MKKGAKRKVLSKIQPFIKKRGGVIMGQKREKMKRVIINDIEFEADIPDSLRQELNLA